ncbi:nSTAND3 domain-containing NTPase [Sphingopyxis fribergensis]
MSINRTAPESFQLQDYICIELVLRFGSAEVVSCVIEPKGGEDATIVTGTPAPRTYEVQIKSSEESVGLDELARWLTHFPEHSDKDMMLERLLADPSRHFLVAISGRVLDMLDGRVAPPEWAGGSLRQPSTELANALLVAFEMSDIEGSAKGKLRDRRLAHHAAVAASLTAAHMRSALSRITIIEKATRASVASQIEQRLRRCGVPDDVVEDARQRLLTVLSFRRKSGEDVAAPLLDQIARETPPSVRPLDYVAGDEEAVWLADLKAKNFLLLSGITRSGKTTAARWIAAELESHGAKIGTFLSIEDADRFLSVPGQGSRLALVDDPLGGAHGVAEPDHALARLEALIPRLAPGRRLIVSQGRERLLEISEAATLDDVTTAGASWVDAGGRNGAFLARLWAHLADRAGVAEPFRSDFEAALAEERVRLEAGTISYLAKLPSVIAGSLSIGAALTAANVDAATLGRALKSEAAAPRLLSALAIGTSAREPIAWADLAFVVDDQTMLLPSRASFNGLFASYGGPAHVHKDMPAYDGAETLDASAVDDINRLEQRQMLVTDASYHSNFTHPFYRSAAELGVFATNQAAKDAMLAMHRRALFARAAATTRAAARNLDWLVARYAAVPAMRSKLIAHAIEGLASLYPATRDLCFDFLLRHLGEAAVLKENILQMAVDAVASVDLASLEWVDGEAMYPVDGHIRDDASWRSWLGPEQEAVAAALAALDSPSGSSLPSEAAAEAILYFKSKPDEMAAAHMSSLLSYQEAVIRAEAGRAWLSVARDDDEELLDRLFRDTHPLVAVRALAGALKAEGVVGTPRGDRIMAGLADFASAPANASLFVQRLARSEYGADGETLRPYAFIEALMPIVLRSLPAGATLIESRLFDAVRDTKDQVSDEAFAAIAETWISWTERLDQAGGWLDDYSLGISVLILDRLGSRSDLRIPLIARLLRLQTTNARLHLIHDCICGWSQLGNDERALVIDVLTEDRSDRLWSQGVALTRTAVPAEIEVALLPDGVMLEDGAATLRSAMPEDLFAACVAVQCGYPGRLGEWEGRGAIWSAITEAIARDPRDPLFIPAFFEAGSGVYSDGGKERFASVLASAAEIDADAIFPHLLERSMYDGGLHHAANWRILLAKGPADGDLSPWLDRLAEAAPVIVSRWIDIGTWIVEPEMRSQVENRLKNDEIALTLLQSILQFAEDLPAIERYEASLTAEELAEEGDDIEPGTLRSKIVDSSILLIGKAPPAFLDTIDVFRDIVTDKAIATNDQTKRLEPIREQVIDGMSKLRDRLKISYKVPEPEGWVPPLQGL